MNSTAFAPHRIAFVAPHIITADEFKPGTKAIAQLVKAVVFNHLLDHPLIALTDTSNDLLGGKDGELLNAHHPDFVQALEKLLETDRRDEVLWFEFGVGSEVPSRLISVGADGRREEFLGVGTEFNSTQIELCLGQWFSSRALRAPETMLEQFSLQDLVAASGCLFQARVHESGEPAYHTPASLKLPFFLALREQLNILVYDRVLACEPHCPWALEEAFQDSSPSDQQQNLPSLRSVLRLAPNFLRAHQSLAQATPDPIEALIAASFSTYLAPMNSTVHALYAEKLSQVGRFTEAVHEAEYGCQLNPSSMAQRCRAVYIKAQEGRIGQTLDTAARHRSFAHRLLAKGVGPIEATELRTLELLFSDALFDVGRMDEAIEIRSLALEGFSLWPEAQDRLNRWQVDPQYASQACSRDAHFRGNPRLAQRALGYGPLKNAQDLIMAIAAELRLGRDDRAAVLTALASGHQLAKDPFAVEISAQAMAQAGQVKTALELLQQVLLGFPNLGQQTGVHQCFRLMACCPIEPWAALIEAKKSAGGGRCAILLARQAADFHPDAANVQQIVQLSKGNCKQKTTFSNSLFSELRAELAQVDLSPLDLFFEENTESTLNAADRLASQWSSLLNPQLIDPADGSTRENFNQCILWALAQALGRYLCLTTNEPNLLAGGYRRLLDSLYELAHQHLDSSTTRSQLVSLLMGLERIAPSVDEWLVDQEILRLESALQIERICHGHWGEVTNKLPTMSRILRGPEKIGTEYRQAKYLCASGDNDAKALQLLERSFRAIGASVADDWAMLAERALPIKKAIDACTTAASGARQTIVPAILAAQLLLKQEKGRAAFDLLTTHLTDQTPNVVQDQLVQLAPLWTINEMPCSADFNSAVREGKAALTDKDNVRAVDCFRWATSIDSESREAWHHLGIASIRAGLFYESLAAFGRFDTTLGAQVAAAHMQSSQNIMGAVLTLETASPWFQSAQLWLQLGYCASVTGKAELATRAYDAASAYGPISDPNHLNNYLGLLEDFGEHETIEALLPSFEKEHGRDPQWASQVLHHRACIHLARSEFEQAAQASALALQGNKAGENRSLFVETLTLSQQNRRREAEPRPSDVGHLYLYDLLENQEWDMLHRLGDALHDSQMPLCRPGPLASSWQECRALLTAACHRSASDNNTRVTVRARNLADTLIQATLGTTDLSAAICLVAASRIREDEFIPRDIPPLLGNAPSHYDLMERLKTNRDNDPDPEVFPGTPVARLSDYVRMTKKMQSENPKGVLAELGLNPTAFGQIRELWAQALEKDAYLAEKLGAMMLN